MRKDDGLLLLIWFCIGTFILILIPLIIFAPKNAHASNLPPQEVLQCWVWVNYRAIPDQTTFIMKVERYHEVEHLPAGTRAQFILHGLRVDSVGRIKPIAGFGYEDSTTNVQIWRVFTVAGAWDVASQWDPSTQAYGNHSSTWATVGWLEGAHRSRFEGYELGEFKDLEQNGRLYRSFSGCEWPEV